MKGPQSGDMSGSKIPVDYSAHDDSCTAACNKNPVRTCSINKLATTRSVRPTLDAKPQQQNQRRIAEANKRT